MKKSWADKWVKALRSGKYKQTTSRLANTDATQHCCLGVLCDISGIGTWSNSNGYMTFVPIKTNESHVLSFLPKSVMNLTGVKDMGGKHQNTDMNLMILNDEKKWSFKKIAAYIEKNYKNL